MRGEAQGLKKELSELVQAQRELLEQADIQALRVQEQRAEARDMRDEAASQGRLVTVFTIISGIFLPLGFFSTASIAFTKPLILFLADVRPVVFQPWQQQRKKWRCWHLHMAILGHYSPGHVLHIFDPGVHRLSRPIRAPKVDTTAC